MNEVIEKTVPEVVVSATSAADEPVVDRSRVTHGQYKRSAIIQIEMKVAERDLDAAKVTALLEELDATNMQMTVSVPEDWLPAGVTLATPKWIDHLSQAHYEALGQIAQANAPGGKKT